MPVLSKFHVLLYLDWDIIYLLLYYHVKFQSLNMTIVSIKCYYMGIIVLYLIAHPDDMNQIWPVTQGHVAKVAMSHNLERFLWLHIYWMNFKPLWWLTHINHCWPQIDMKVIYGDKLHLAECNKNITGLMGNSDISYFQIHVRLIFLANTHHELPPNLTWEQS